MGLSISLRKILVAFAYYSFPHPDHSKKPIRTCTYQIGYCQSLNFIVGFLLLVFTRNNNNDVNSSQQVNQDIEEKVFWLLIIIVEKLMPQKMYGSDIVGARMQQQVLWKWIVEEHGESFGLSQLSKWLDETDRRLDPFLSITTGWFMNLFITILPNDTTLRILDSFFYQGEKTLYRTAIGLFQIYQKDIIGFHDWFDACRYIKNAPKRMIQGHILIERMFRKFNPVELRQKNIDDQDQDHYQWVTLQNNYLPGEKRDSVEDLEIQSTSHLGKSVIAHAIYALSNSNASPAKKFIGIDSRLAAMFF